MGIKELLLEIRNFKIDEEMEDYEISEHFDKIRERLTDISPFTKFQKKELIDSLFQFLKSQDPEMDENFSYIHFIESIDNTDYEIYYPKLLRFNNENGTTTSILLLNRFINSLEGIELKKCVKLLKHISENDDYTKYVREFALDFYQHQIEKQQNT